MACLQWFETVRNLNRYHHVDPIYPLVGSLPARMEAMWTEHNFNLNSPLQFSQETSLSTKRCVGRVIYSFQSRG